MANTQIGLRAAVEKAKEAATVAKLIGGAEGADHRANAHLLQHNCMFRLGDMAPAARFACSLLRATRATGNRPFLVTALTSCADVAKRAPDEMAKAERESRDQERFSGSPPSYGGLDLSQEGRVSLPTSPAALSRLELTYREASVASCDAALAAVGGRGSPDADDKQLVPSLCFEAATRGYLGICLIDLGEERERGFALIRQAVPLLRKRLRTAASWDDAVLSEHSLAGWLCHLGHLLSTHSSQTVEAAACLRGAQELSETLNDVLLKQDVLRYLANMSGRPDQPVGLAEATTLRSRLNALYV